MAGPVLPPGGLGAWGRVGEIRKESPVCLPPGPSCASETTLGRHHSQITPCSPSEVCLSLSKSPEQCLVVQALSVSCSRTGHPAKRPPPP